MARGSTDIAEQLSRDSAAGLAVNIGAYIGFNSVWATVMGASDHRPSEADIQQMRQMITRNLERGAWGVSAGLDYKPAYYARTDEVIRILNLPRRGGRIFRIMTASLRKATTARSPAWRKRSKSARKAAWYRSSRT